jgi:hypothetical protein
VAGPRGPINLWGVPLSVLVAAVGGTVVALTAASSSTQGTFVFETPVDPRLTLLIFALPVATALAALVAFFTGIRWGPRVGPLLGASAGLIGAAVVGSRYETLASWWTQYVPTDTNRAAAYLVAWIVGLLSVTVTLTVAALAGPVPRARRRNRILGLGIVSSLQGLLLGLFVGAAVAAIDAALQTCAFCVTPDVGVAAEGGALLGSWVGALVGLVVGIAIGAAALLALPADGPATGDPPGLRNAGG